MLNPAAFKLAPSFTAEGVAISPQSSYQWSLRASIDDLPRLTDAWLSPIPIEPLSSVSSESRHALRLGPDEWLLLADSETAADSLAALPQTPPFSLVDISNREVAWQIEGPRAVDVLGTGCPLDLSDAAFPPGRATRTVYGQAEILIWRQGTEPVWRIQVLRSFMDYVTRYLSQSITHL